jgi:hypothetical protein
MRRHLSRDRNATSIDAYVLFRHRSTMCTENHIDRNTTLMATVHGKANLKLTTGV